MKKTVLFFLLEPFADWEAAYLSSAIYMLGKGAFEVKTVSFTKQNVSSIGGFHVFPDYDLNSVPTEYAGLILIGGLAWRNTETRKIVPLIQKTQNQNRILGGICDAAGFLAAAGMLNCVYHTGNDLNDIKQWAGNMYTGENLYLKQQAVRDHNVITANGTAALEFAKEVLLALRVAPEDKIEEWFQFHKLGYYEAPMPDMQ